MRATTAKAAITKPRRLVAWRYNRVSNDKRKRSRSIPQQDAEAKQVIAENDWIDGGAYEDPDTSASRFSRKKRPDWDRLLEDLATRPPDILIVWEPSRGTRRLSVWATLLETCQTLGVKIHVTSHHQTYDLSNPRHWRTLAEDGVDSGYEVEKTSVRVKRDLANAAELGRPHGNLLFGYRRVYDKDSGDFVRQTVDRKQAKIIRDVAAAFISGSSINAIVTDLNDRGVPSPRDAGWSGTYIRKMLGNQAYLGKRVHHGVVAADDAWPAILDETTFYACRRILTDPARRTSKDTAIKHVLSQLATGRCGRPLRVGRNGGQWCYRCKIDGCVSIRTDVLEDYVRDVLCAYLADPDVLARLSNPARDDDAIAAEDEAEALRAQLRSYHDAAERNELDALDLAEMTRRLRPKITAAEERAKQLQVSPLVRKYGGTDIARRWPSLPLLVQRELVREHLEVQVLPVGRGYRMADVSDRVVITPRG